MGYAKPIVFLCYARKDKDKVEKLYQKLSDAGFYPWMDVQDILAGENWKSVLLQTIREAPFFLACLSENSVNKRGIVQIEIREALDVWRQKLDTDIYLIPVRLDTCVVPEMLNTFQWVDLYEERGFQRLVSALETGMMRLGIDLPVPRKSQPERITNVGEEEMLKLLSAWAEAFWRFRDDIGIGDDFETENNRLNNNLLKLRGDLITGNPTTPQKIRSFLRDYGVLTSELDHIISRVEKEIGIIYMEYLRY